MVEQPIEKTGLMTIEEFVRLYETEGPFEIVDGERIPVNPVVAGHGDSARIIHDEFAAYNRDHKTAISYFELAYVLTYSSDWVKGSREPDVMVYRMERMLAYRAEHPNWRDLPFIIVPDLVVEVISRNDRYTEIDEKVERYLNDGVELIWVVDPRQNSVTVRGRDFYKKHHLNDTLTGGDIIPGFEMPVKAIFA